MVELPGRGETFVRDTGADSPGDGPPLLLLHGLGANADLNWHAAFGPLSRRHRVIALDHRGHGRGIRPTDGRFRLSDCADDAEALCEVLGLDHVVAVGYSMGGPVAQMLWHRHRERVAGLVLCATFPYVVDTQRRRRLARAVLPGFFGMLKVLPPAATEELRQRVRRERLDGHPWQAWLEAEGERNERALVIDAARALTAFSSRTWIDGVDVPTAVVVTLDDRLVPAERQRRLAAAIQGALVVEAHADHLDVSLRPERFTSSLLKAVDLVSHRVEAAR